MTLFTQVFPEWRNKKMSVARYFKYIFHIGKMQVLMGFVLALFNEHQVHSSINSFTRAL